MREATDDEREILHRLHLTILDRSQRNAQRSRFHDAEERLVAHGVTIPPGMEDFEVALNWPAKAVSSFAARQVPAGFSSMTESSLLEDIDRVYEDNNFAAVERWAIEAADEHGCSFVFTTLGDTAAGEPEIVLSARTALSATAELDPRTRRVKAAMELIGGARVILHLPDRVMTCVRRPASWWVEDERRIGTGGRVLCAPFVHGGSLRRPLGRSRISPTLMHLTHAACRTLLRQEVTAEFWQAPRLALMGADSSVFTDPTTGRRLSPLEVLTGAIWAIPDVGEEDQDDLPDTLRRAEFKQIAQGSMDPFNAQYRLLASAASGATSLPPAYLGITQDSNPTSAQAIEATEVDLIREVRAQNPSLGIGRRDLALNILACIYGELDEDRRAELRGLHANWEDPRTRSMSEQSQMAALQVQAGNMQPGTKTTLSMLPISQQAIAAAVEENRRAAGSGILDRVLEAGGDESQDSLTDRATALGTLVRAGVTPQSAMRAAGLEGLEFLPGRPVTIRDESD